MLFPNGDWTLLKSTFLLLPVSHFQHFPSAQVADVLYLADWQLGEDFWGTDIGPRRLIKMTLVPKTHKFRMESKPGCWKKAVY